MIFLIVAAPPAPSGVRVTPLPQRGVLRVTWRAPTVDTGLTITGYSVQYRTSSTGPYSRARTVSGRSTSTAISGLQLGTRYRVRVAAVTQLGTGAYSSDVGGTTYNGECTGEYLIIPCSFVVLIFCTYIINICICYICHCSRVYFIISLHTSFQRIKFTIGEWMMNSQILYTTMGSMGCILYILGKTFNLVNA